jgi:hypothetical protein
MMMMMMMTVTRIILPTNTRMCNARLGGKATGSGLCVRLPLPQSREWEGGRELGFGFCVRLINMTVHEQGESGLRTVLIRLHPSGKRLREKRNDGAKRSFPSALPTPVISPRARLEQRRRRWIRANADLKIQPAPTIPPRWNCQ